MTTSRIANAPIPMTIPMRRRSGSNFHDPGCGVEYPSLWGERRIDAVGLREQAMAGRAVASDTIVPAVAGGRASRQWHPAH
jgi:hypothetical protein